MTALAQLVLRLDDACATRKRAAWDAAENLLNHHGIRPIVGVIPNCKDPGLAYEPEDADFWGTVRRWRDQDWVIALHGETHAYSSSPKEARSLVPFHPSGEYVGRPLDDQRQSIRRSWELFRAQDIRPAIFMAPAHAFDETTIQALKLETDIRWLTDGISWRPFRRYGFNWLPQQLFRVRSPLMGGLWTVCLHPNSMTEKEFDALGLDLVRYGRHFVDPADLITTEPSRYGLSDALFAATYWRLAALKWKRPPSD